MWQRFTEHARKAVFYAQEEAQKKGEGYVSTEHLLLGLTRESDNVAIRALEQMGLSRDRVRDEVEQHLQKGEARPSQDMTLTPRAKRVIDLAYDEARGLNNNYIGTEHLLLGLIREGDGLAGRILAKLDVDLERIREIIKSMQDFEDASSPERVPTELRQPKGSSTTLLAVRGKVAIDVRALGVRFIGTHDYLWEFLQREDCVAYRALVAAGLDIGTLRAELEKVRNVPPVSVESAKDDPIAASAHAEASRIASTMSAAPNTGHLLLAMIVLSWSSVYLMISNTGVAYEHLWILVSQMDGED